MSESGDAVGRGRRTWLVVAAAVWADAPLFRRK
jgi:hypothetical protein